jgi:hypothetical protein
MSAVTTEGIVAVTPVSSDPLPMKYPRPPAAVTFPFSNITLAMFPTFDAKISLKK